MVLFAATSDWRFQKSKIYLPISSTMMLGFFCRSHEADIRNGVDRMRARFVRDPDSPMQGFGPLLDWMRAFRKGTPLPSEAENVLNHNSLQVRQAERYVFPVCRIFRWSRT